MTDPLEYAKRIDSEQPWLWSDIPFRGASIDVARAYIALRREKEGRVRTIVIVATGDRDAKGRHLVTVDVQHPTDCELDYRTKFWRSRFGSDAALRPDEYCSDECSRMVTALLRLEEQG